VYTLAGGLSIPDYPEITIGVCVNWYAQSLLDDYVFQVGKTTTVTYDVDPPIVASSLTDMAMFDDFRALNFTLGLLWDAYEKQENLLTFGLVYHTPFTARVDRELHSTINNGSPSFYQDSIDIDFPASLGAGVNYRFSDLFSVAFDVEWKEWSKFSQKYADGKEDSPVDDDTLAYRLGGEHLFLGDVRESVFACRGGVFYEPCQLVEYPDSVPVYGFSAGFGWTDWTDWTPGKKYSIDFAYQYRWGEGDLGNFDYRIEEQFIIVSLITYF
jgi:long-subunit fatty acid transport protein